MGELTFLNHLIDKLCKIGLKFFCSASVVVGSLLGPVIPSFRALSGRPKCTFQRHDFNQDSLSWQTILSEVDMPGVPH